MTGNDGRMAGGQMSGRSVTPMEQPALVGQVLTVQEQATELEKLATQLENAVQRLKAEPQDSGAGSATGNTPVPVLSLENRLDGLRVNMSSVIGRLRAVADRLDRAV